MRFWLMIFLALLLATTTALLGARADDEAAAWRALAAGGHVALMRHALAPGTGDPDGFRVDDCATQRNLNDAGRTQARAVGDLFRANGIAVGRVLSSQWCRCLETAELMDLGPVEPFEPLNSFFQDRGARDARVAGMRRFIAELPEGPSVLMVTHQVNIRGATGEYAQSGEIVVARPDGRGGIEVVGSIYLAPDD